MFKSTFGTKGLELIMPTEVIYPFEKDNPLWTQNSAIVTLQIRIPFHYSYPWLVLNLSQNCLSEHLGPVH